VTARPPGGSFPDKLHHNVLLLPTVLILVVAGLLVHGFLQRDEYTTQAQESELAPAPSPTATPFRPELEKVPLSYFSDYWLQLGERSHDLLLTLGEAQVTAVRVTRGYALGSLAAADAVTAAPGHAPEGELVAANGKLGLALFRVADELGAPPRPVADSLHAGAWLMAVTSDPDQGLQVTPGHLVSAPPPEAQRLDVAIDFAPALDAAAVVDLDGRLAGVALRGPSGVQVLSTEAARAIIEGLAARPSCRAVDVAPLSEDVAAALRVMDGVVVETVASEAFVSPPDLRPGDVLLQLGAIRLPDPSVFAQTWDSLEPGSRARFLIARGGRRVVRRIELPGRDCRPAGSTPRELPLLGSVVQWSMGGEEGRDTETGFRVLNVPSASPAAAAGLQRDDLLVAVDGEALAWPDARSLLDDDWGRGQTPVFTVRRGNTARLTVVQGEDE
jgi:S1-C subfamily serine protease